MHFRYSDTLFLKKNDTCIKIGFGNFSFVEEPIHIERELSLLHCKEVEYLNQLKFKDRFYSYVLGRISGKFAAKELYPYFNERDIWIDHGVFGQPILKHPELHNLQVGISHSGKQGAAIVFPEAFPMGIDIELMDPNKTGLLESQMTHSELSKVMKFGADYPFYVMMLWTAKESLSKVLKTGLTLSLEILEIESIKYKGTYFEINY
ncbi:4'-phosphopantetheinyl transferase family protein, partial [Saccharibacillus sacchari]